MHPALTGADVAISRERRRLDLSETLIPGCPHPGCLLTGGGSGFIAERGDLLVGAVHRGPSLVADETPGAAGGRRQSTLLGRYLRGGGRVGTPSCGEGGTLLLGERLVQSVGLLGRDDIDPGVGGRCGVCDLTCLRRYLGSNTVDPLTGSLGDCARRRRRFGSISYRGRQLSVPVTDQAGDSSVACAALQGEQLVVPLCRGAGRCRCPLAALAPRAALSGIAGADSASRRTVPRSLPESPGCARRASGPSGIGAIRWAPSGALARTRSKSEDPSASRPGGGTRRRLFHQSPAAGK